MPLEAVKAYEHSGETMGFADYIHDLFHELSTRLDALWRYDQYINNAENHPQAQELWRDLKRQTQADVQRLKRLVAEEIERGCF